MAQAAVLYGLMGTAWAFMQFFCSPIQGALSDRFGGRPVVLLSNLGLVVDYVDYMVMALATNDAWLVEGRVISGMASSSFRTAGAYIADVNLPEQRAAAFGKIGMAGNESWWKDWLVFMGDECVSDIHPQVAGKGIK
jgi:MFS transporter, DHA1 family, tetracycline resistance protein